MLFVDGENLSKRGAEALQANGTGDSPISLGPDHSRELAAQRDGTGCCPGPLVTSPGFALESEGGNPRGERHKQARNQGREWPPPERCPVLADLLGNRIALLFRNYREGYGRDHEGSGVVHKWCVVFAPSAITGRHCCEGAAPSARRARMTRKRSDWARRRAANR